MIDFTLTSRQQQVKEAIHGLALSVIRPECLKWDREHGIPPEFLRTLAHAIGSATGAFRCEVQVEGEDPFFEFFSIRVGRLLRQRGVIVRQQEDDITSGEPDA